MASIRQEIITKARPEQVWDAIRDIGALHTRLVPGFVVATELEPGARIVTFGNGLVVKELIVDIDDDRRRLVWSARDARLMHHNASVEVLAGLDGGSRILWTADLLPDDMTAPIAAMIAEAAKVMAATLDRLAI